MSDLEKRLDKVIAGWQERTLAELPIRQTAAMYAAMRAEQRAIGPVIVHDAEGRVITDKPPI